MINKNNYNIFICNSIFHLILSISIILDNKIKKKSTIYIFNDNLFLKNDYYNKLIKWWFLVKVIETNNIYKRYFNPFFIKLPNIRNKNIDVFFFINYPLSNQILNLKIKKKFKNVSFNIIEEWIWSYIKRDKNSIIINFLNYFLKLFNLKITKNWGELNYFINKYVRFPEFIDNKIWLIKYNILLLLNNNIQIIKNILLEKNKLIFWKDDIIFISNSLVFNDTEEYINNIIYLKNKYKNKNFYLKPHPREDINIFKKIKNIKLIDKNIPIELIWNNTNIISFYSSSILNLNSNITLIKSDNNDLKKLIEIIKFYNIKNINIVNLF